MRLIKLTSLQNKKPIYVNIDAIGHFYEVEDVKGKHTRIGITTHNNGGFLVTENITKILKLIEESKGI